MQKIQPVSNKSSIAEDKYHRANQQEFIFDFKKQQESQKGLDGYLKARANVYMTLLSNKTITQQEMKVQFSIDILRSVFASNQLYDLDNKTAKTYVKLIQKNLKDNLKYLKIIYPRNKKTQIASQLITQIKDCDYLDKCQYDIMAQTQTIFTYKNGQYDSGTQILDQIKEFINKLIEQSRASYSTFQQILKVDMMKIIQDQNHKQAKQISDIFNDTHKFKIGMKIPEDHPLIQDYGSQRFNIQTTQLFRLILKWIEQLSKIVQNKQETLLDQKYFKKVKNLNQDYEKEKQSLLSKKIKKNQSINKQGQDQDVNLFNLLVNEKSQLSRQEKKNNQSPKKNIKQTKQEDGFFDSFFKKVSNLCTGYQEEQNATTNVIESFKDLALTMNPAQKIQFQSYRYNIQGSPINYYLQALSGLNKDKQSEKFVQNQMKDLQQKYFEIIKIVQKNNLVQKFSLQEKKIYSFSQFTYQFLRGMVAQRLVNLIKMLVNFRYSQTKDSFDDKGQFKDIDLVTFRISDLNRARLMLNQKQVLLVFAALQKLHSNGKIQIAKVKNRFNQAMNDSIIIFKMIGSLDSPILCELQLILAKNFHQTGDNKEKASQIMNHYLYQIQRATYGPLSQLALIIATKDHRIQYLWKIQPNAPNKKILLSKTCYCKDNKGQMSEQVRKNHQDLNFDLIKPDSKDVIDNSKWKSLLPEAFICGICQRVYGKGQNLFAIMKCKQCNFHVCSQCQFEGDSGAAKNRYKKAFEYILSFGYPLRKSQQNVNKIYDVEYNMNQDKQQLIGNKFKISLNNAIVRYKQGQNSKKFWKKVRIQFQQSIKKNKDGQQTVGQKFQSYGVLIKLSEVFANDGIPFMIVSYDRQSKKFYKTVFQNSKLRGEQMDDADLSIKKFDAFFFICSRAISENKILQKWVSQVYKLNPFLKKKIIGNDEIDDQIKLKRGLLKLKNVYDDQLQIHDTNLNKADFNVFQGSLQVGHKLSTIKFLNLNSNNIQKIDGLTSLINVEDIRITNNLIQSLQINGNQKFPKLKALYIGNNYIENLIITNHSIIEIISAENNPFERIQLVNLMNLNFFKFGGQDPEYEWQFQSDDGEQQMQSIEKIQLKRLPKLTTLWWNRISINPDNFKFNGLDFPNLHRIDFKYTNLKISTLPATLEYLNVNDMKDQYILIKNKPKLKSVNIKKSSLQQFQIPQKISKIVLRIYDFKHPSLQIDSKTLKQFRFQILPSSDDSESIFKPQDSKISIKQFLESDLPNLQILQLTNVGKNQNLKLSQKISFEKFKKLKHLQIFETPIGGISDLPNTLKSLLVTQKESHLNQKFDLSYNAIQNLSKLKLINAKTDNIKLSPGLQFLQLQQNSLKQIQQNNCQFLKTIDIHHNPNCNLQGLENSNLPNLNSMKLTFNDIIKLNFKNVLKQLKSLDLSDNRITSMIWIFKGNFPNLQQVILQRNAIQHLQMIDHVNLKRIFISQNPMMNLLADAEKIKNSFQNEEQFDMLSEQLQTLQIFPINNLGDIIQSYEYEKCDEISDILMDIFQNLYDI